MSVKTKYQNSYSGNLLSYSVVPYTEDQDFQTFSYDANSTSCTFNRDKIVKAPYISVFKQLSDNSVDLFSSTGGWTEASYFGCFFLQPAYNTDAFIPLSIDSTHGTQFRFTQPWLSSYVKRLLLSPMRSTLQYDQDKNSFTFELSYVYPKGFVNDPGFSNDPKRYTFTINSDRQNTSEFVKIDLPYIDDEKNIKITSVNCRIQILTENFIDLFNQAGNEQFFDQLSENAKKLLFPSIDTEDGSVSRFDEKSMFPFVLLITSETNNNNLTPRFFINDNIAFIDRTTVDANRNGFEYLINLRSQGTVGDVFTATLPIFGQTNILGLLYYGPQPKDLYTTGVTTELVGGSFSASPLPSSVRSGDIVFIDFLGFPPNIEISCVWANRDNQPAWIQGTKDVSDLRPFQYKFEYFIIDPMNPPQILNSGTLFNIEKQAYIGLRSSKSDENIFVWTTDKTKAVVFQFNIFIDDMDETTRYDALTYGLRYAISIKDSDRIKPLSAVSEGIYFAVPPFADVCCTDQENVFRIIENF